MSESTREDELKDAAAAALDLIDPHKPLGTKLFTAVARVSVSTCIEAVCLRYGRNGRIEVLLTRHDDKHPGHPRMWHAPGTVMRPGERIQTMFDRLVDIEFGTTIKHYQFVGFDINEAEPRGHFIHLVYLIVLDDMSDANLKGENGWFDITEPPEGIVPHHAWTVIPMAARKFRGE